VLADPGVLRRPVLPRRRTGRVHHDDRLHVSGHLRQTGSGSALTQRGAPGTHRARAGGVAYGQLPPVGIDTGELWPGHTRSHVPPAPQLTEQLPVHVTWHVASVQLTLLLGPTVSSHVAPAAQLALQEVPHVPPQLWPVAHWSEQLLFSWVHPVA